MPPLGGVELVILFCGASVIGTIGLTVFAVVTVIRRANRNKGG